MADFPVSQHHAQSFTSNVELLAQQVDHRLRGTYSMGNYVGESGQVVKQFDTVEFEEKTAKFGDTNLSELAHKQRWVFPADFTLALPIEREDEIRTLGSLESPYAAAMAAAWNRKKDSIISTALTSSAKTGKNGGTTTAFDSTNMQVGVDATVGGTTSANTGMTVNKLILAREKLDEQEVGEDETRYMGVRRKQITDLLTDTNVTSADFNTIKALVRGDVNEFMGFTFVRYEGFDVGTAGTDIATCPFWVGSGIHLGSWNGLQSRVAERADKNHITQIFMRGTIGATRTQEKKVGSVLCDQSP